MLNEIETMPTELKQILEQGPIPVFKPSYGSRELEHVRECLDKGWTGCGPKVKQFEEAFADYVGVKYAVAVSSCTAALHLALMTLDLEGAEVITTPMTFVSTNHAILYNKGVPVFADIEPDTLNLDSKKIEALITDKTKAIMAVHFGGHACEMNSLLEIAREHDLKVIEDVAHGCGGSYLGKKLGSIGDLACFSFHAVKNLATGDGGMIVTDDESVRDRLYKLRWVGISKDTWDRNSTGKYSWDYNIEELGFKYQMNDISAGIGLAQLEKIDELNSERGRIASDYDRAFERIPGIEPLSVKDYTFKAHHNYVVKTDRRDELMEFLKERKISTGVHYRPNNHYDLYRDAKGETPVCEEVWKSIVTLPLYPSMTDVEKDYVIRSVKSFFLL